MVLSEVTSQPLTQALEDLRQSGASTIKIIDATGIDCTSDFFVDKTSMPKEYLLLNKSAKNGIYLLTYSNMDQSIPLKFIIAQ